MPVCASTSLELTLCHPKFLYPLSVTGLISFPVPRSCEIWGANSDLQQLADARVRKTGALSSATGQRHSGHDHTPPSAVSGHGKNPPTRKVAEVILSFSPSFSPLNGYAVVTGLGLSW